MSGVKSNRISLREFSSELVLKPYVGDTAISIRNLCLLKSSDEHSLTLLSPQFTVQAMAEAEATTLLANDVNFLNHVIGKLPTGAASLTVGTLATGLTNDEGAQKIADDALKVFKYFQSSMDALCWVDGQFPGWGWSRKVDNQRSVGCMVAHPSQEGLVCL